jgi:PAS domain S-box-containing protein
MQIHRIPAGAKPDQLLDHERLSALINSMTDAVLAIDKSGLITLSNSVALSLLDANRLTGRRLDEALKLLDKDGRPVDIKASILDVAPPFSNSDWRLKYSDGSTISLSFSSSPVRGGFGSAGADGHVLLFRDITKEKSVEEEREEFVSVASHELRTPIAIAEGNISNAQLLADRTSTPDSVKQSLATAHDQIIFLGNLINDLSMLSRADRSKLALTIEQIDVPELVNSLIHDYEPQAGKKGLSLEANVSSDADVLISSRLYVREVLQNFLTNALKYTEKGGIILSATKINDGIEFMVMDTGIGISKSEQSQLFGKFFRSDDWRVKKVNGTGLGLYITSKLAKLIGGSIQMESELNKGSNFKIFVPNSEPPATKT